MKVRIEYSKFIKIENYASNSLIEVPENARFATCFHS